MSKGLAIVGIGEVPTGIYPDRSRWDILYEVCMAAIRDAGVDKNDVGGVVSVAPQAQPRITGEIAFGKIPEELGLHGCQDICIANAGGASTTNCLRLAEQYLDSGVAKFVLIPHVTVQSDIPVMDLINFFAVSGVDLQWEYPFGSTFNGSMGLITNRYMYETGTTAEEMAAVTVALRQWGALDPNSMFYKKPLTLEQVLESRMISTPLHAKECNMLADGGGALLVTTPEIAKEMSGKAVYKRGHGARFTGATPLLRKDVFWRESYRGAIADALAQANMTKDDMDIWQIYGAYPFTQCSALEAAGVCEIGEAGKMYLEGRFSPGGDIPVTTMGDATGRGHSGSGVSMAFYIELARQLRSEAGERQVQDCNNLLVTTSGGSGMNTLATVFGREAK